MNVLDHLKSSSVDDIKSYCKSTSINAGVAMMHVNGDFNLSTLVRNANFFGFKEAFYVGGSKQWDHRGNLWRFNLWSNLFCIWSLHRNQDITGN